MQTSSFRSLAEHSPSSFIVSAVLFPSLMRLTVVFAAVSVCWSLLHASLSDEDDDKGPPLVVFFCCSILTYLRVASPLRSESAQPIQDQLILWAAKCAFTWAKSLVLTLMSTVLCEISIWFGLLKYCVIYCGCQSHQQESGGLLLMLLNQKFGAMQLLNGIS